MALLTKKKFLKKYNYKEKKFNKTKLKWNELKKIYENYKSIEDDLEDIGNFIQIRLGKSKNVHSTKMRIKDPEHLKEKIIRKKIENKDLLINTENYKEVIKDLIGVRLLHLFKEEWLEIHPHI